MVLREGEVNPARRTTQEPGPIYHMTHDYQRHRFPGGQFMSDLFTILSSHLIPMLLCASHSFSEYHERKPQLLLQTVVLGISAR